MTAETFTREAQERLKQYLSRPGYIIPIGLGDKEAAGSVAAINLAISGTLTDDIPECMSQVIGKWVINVQDRMPEELRNSERWKTALVYAAGTGRDYEDERFDMLVRWMWTTVLPSVQPTADKHGFGEQWRHMCDTRTEAATRNLYRVIFKRCGNPTRRIGQYDFPEDAFEAAYAAVNAADVARAKVKDDINVELSYISAMAFTLSHVIDASNDPNIWERFNPPGLLEHLVWYKAIGRVVYA